jgi:hypothetical protein
MNNQAISIGNELKPLTVQIPIWIESVEEIAIKANLKPDRAKAVLHQFFLAWFKNEMIRKNKKVNLLPEYFAVSSELLKEIGTRDYNRYVALLLKEKIIERKENSSGGRCYSPGKHAQLYRWILPVNYVGLPQFRIDKITDFLTMKSILRTRDNHQKISFKMGEERENSSIFETLKSYVLDTIIINGNYQLIDEVNWFVVDAFGRRFHHIISSMPKEQRKFLRFKGHEQTPLVTIDFKNSQPFFSAMLSSKTLIDTLLPEFKAVLPLAEQLISKPDFLLYRQLCVEGRLYEFFLEALGIDSSNKLERDKIKETLFRAVLFSRKRVYGDDKRFKLQFQSAFPSVFSFFSEIKRMNEDELPELKSIIKPNNENFKFKQSNNSYKLLACMMQRAESRMIYQVIAPRLMEDGIKFITVHDSFIVLPENVGLTNIIIRESFESIGLTSPSLSIK